MAHEREKRRNQNNGVWLRKGYKNWVLLFKHEVEWYFDNEYIVNDEQAELRKIKADLPDTKFEVAPDSMIGWIDANENYKEWDSSVPYRLKEKEYEYQWIFKNYNDKWIITEKFYKENPKLGYSTCLPFEFTKKEIKE